VCLSFVWKTKIIFARKSSLPSRDFYGREIDHRESYDDGVEKTDEKHNR